MLPALLLFVSMVIPLPADSPVPCVICEATLAASATTFSGTVAQNGPTLRVWNATTLRSMEFSVPSGFHGVESGDGVIKDATLARATPGLLAQVTYTSVHGRNIASKVLLLTVAQCRSLAASAGATDKKTSCPD